MNREEAISELQKAIDLIKQNGKDWLDERDIPILQMAITALELSDSIMLQLDCKMFHSGVDVESTISEATPSVQFAKDTNVPNNDTISRQVVIDILDIGKEFLMRALDDMDVVGQDREKYSWGLGLIESYIWDIEGLPSAQPEIIYCGDCKYYHHDDYELPYCDRKLGFYAVDLDDFCSRGVRRTDE